MNNITRDQQRIWESVFAACIVGKSQSPTIPGPAGLAEWAAKTADAAVTEHAERFPPGKD